MLSSADSYEVTSIPTVISQTMGVVHSMGLLLGSGQHCRHDGRVFYTPPPLAIAAPDTGWCREVPPRPDQCLSVGIVAEGLTQERQRRSGPRSLAVEESLQHAFTRAKVLPMTDWGPIRQSSADRRADPAARAYDQSQSLLRRGGLVLLPNAACRILVLQAVLIHNLERTQSVRSQNHRHALAVLCGLNHERLSQDPDVAESLGLQRFFQLMGAGDMRPSIVRSLIGPLDIRAVELSGIGVARYPVLAMSLGLTDDRNWRNEEGLGLQPGWPSHAGALGNRQ